MIAEKPHRMQKRFIFISSTIMVRVFESDAFFIQGYCIVPPPPYFRFSISIQCIEYLHSLTLISRAKKKQTSVVIKEEETEDKKL